MFLRVAGMTTVIVGIELVVWRRSELFVLEWMSSGDQIAGYSITFAAVWGLTRVVDAVAAVVSPAVASLVGAGDLDRVRRGFWRMSRLLLLIAPPAAVAMATLGPTLVRSVYGEPYADVGPVLLVLTVPVPVLPLLTAAAGDALRPRPGALPGRRRAGRHRRRHRAGRRPRAGVRGDGSGGRKHRRAARRRRACPRAGRPVARPGRPGRRRGRRQRRRRRDRRRRRARHGCRARGLRQRRRRRRRRHDRVVRGRRPPPPGAPRRRGVARRHAGRRRPRPPADEAVSAAASRTSGRRSARR